MALTPIGRLPSSGSFNAWTADFNIVATVGVLNWIQVELPLEGLRAGMQGFINLRDPHADDFIFLCQHIADDSVHVWLLNLSRGSGDFDEPATLTVWSPLP